MDDRKKTSKAAFNQQAPTYDNDMRGQHAGSVETAVTDSILFCTGSGMGDRGNDETDSGGG